MVTVWVPAPLVRYVASVTCSKVPSFGLGCLCVAVRTVVEWHGRSACVVTVVMVMVVWTERASRANYLYRTVAPRAKFYVLSRRWDHGNRRRLQRDAGPGEKDWA